MKEATGELNMTVVTVVAIAAVGAFFYMLIWPAIQTNILNSTKCANAVCPPAGQDADTVECTYIDEKNQTQKVTCPVQKGGATNK